LRTKKNQRIKHIVKPFKMPLETYFLFRITPLKRGWLIEGKNEKEQWKKLFFCLPKERAQSLCDLLNDSVETNF